MDFLSSIMTISEEWERDSSAPAVSDLGVSATCSIVHPRSFFPLHLRSTVSIFGLTAAWAHSAFWLGGYLSPFRLLSQNATDWVAYNNRNLLFIVPESRSLAMPQGWVRALFWVVDSLFCPDVAVALWVSLEPPL